MLRQTDDSNPRDTGRVWGTGIARRRPAPARSAVVGSLVCHVLLVGFIVVSGFVFKKELPKFEVYRVNLVSPPPQLAGIPEPAVAAPTVARRPEPTKVSEAPRPKPQPKRPVQQKTATPEPARRDPPPTRGQNPDPNSPGGENLDVNMEGREFPFPSYLENIIIQLNRSFRWEGNPTLKGKVTFMIKRDGSVDRSSLRVIEKSGEFQFDLKMMSAVEQASNRGLFGPLPEGWLFDTLPIVYTFLPPR